MKLFFSTLILMAAASLGAQTAPKDAPPTINPATEHGCFQSTELVGDECQFLVTFHLPSDRPVVCVKATTTDKGSQVYVCRWPAKIEEKKPTDRPAGSLTNEK